MESCAISHKVKRNKVKLEHDVKQIIADTFSLTFSQTCQLTDVERIEGSTDQVIASVCTGEVVSEEQEADVDVSHYFVDTKEKYAKKLKS